VDGRMVETLKRKVDTARTLREEFEEEDEVAPLAPLYSALFSPLYAYPFLFTTILYYTILYFTLLYSTLSLLPHYVSPYSTFTAQL
jgi:hypothetical protein